jgi:hypothetical protein
MNLQKGDDFTTKTKVDLPPKNLSKYYVSIREENFQKEAGHIYRCLLEVLPPQYMLKFLLLLLFEKKYLLLFFKIQFTILLQHGTYME